jgi:hypothetical protein
VPSFHADTEFRSTSSWDASLCCASPRCSINAASRRGRTYSGSRSDGRGWRVTPTILGASGCSEGRDPSAMPSLLGLRSPLGPLPYHHRRPSGGDLGMHPHAQQIRLGDSMAVHPGVDARRQTQAARPLSPTRAGARPRSGQIPVPTSSSSRWRRGQVATPAAAQAREAPFGTARSPS